MKKLTHEEEMQAITDALAAIATAVARQVDANWFLNDLLILAEAAETNGKWPSAELLKSLLRGVAERLNRAGKGH